MAPNSHRNVRKRVEWARSCVSEEDWERRIKPRFCEETATHGDIEMLKWLRAEGCPWDAWVCARAACGGHLEVLNWLQAEGCPREENACTEAAASEATKVMIYKWQLEI